MKFYSSILFKLIVGIFIVELIMMVALERVVNLNVYTEMVLDASILSLFMAIMFYLYLKRPLNMVFGVIAAVKDKRFDVQTGVQGKDEISKLAVHIDQMAAALQKSEDLFSKITSSAHDAIIVLDNDGQVSFWNESASKMFGYGLDEIKGGDFHNVIVPASYHGDFRKGWEEFKGTGQGAAVGKVLELSALRKDGTEFPVELSVSAIKIDDKWCSVGMVKDISERKGLENDLKKRLDELERFNKITMDREKRVIELKEEIERLKGRG